MKQKKTGLFFGSFNPIHTGHLILAQHFINKGLVSEVWFIVSPHNPLKTKDSLLADHHRLAMVRIAVEDNPRLKASDIEFHLPTPSYTSHTLAHLHEKFPDRKFGLIIGEDNLKSFRKWKNWESILQQEFLMIYPRRTAEPPNDLYQHPHVFICSDAPVIELSSTEIRNGIKEGYDMRYCMPEKVFLYMREMHFYEKKN